MTDMTTHDETLPVEQVDRDAAADAVKAYRGTKNNDWQGRIRRGEADDGEMVQAFARHRRAAQSPPPVSEGVDRTRWLIDWLNMNAADYPDGQDNHYRAAADLIERLSQVPPEPVGEALEGVREHAARLHEALDRQANSTWGLDGDECALEDALERYFAAIRNLAKEQQP